VATAAPEWCVFRYRRSRAGRLAAPHASDAAELELDAALDVELWEYLVMAAHSLVNVDPAHGRPTPA
jgi:hypothetical protein